MNAPRHVVVSGRAVSIAEARCVCGKSLTLVLVPGARFRHEDAVCWACVPAVRLEAA